MPKVNRPESQPVEIEYGGKKYSGWYVVERGGVTVTSPSWGTKYAVLHASPPDVLARMLLRELLDEAKARGDL